MPERVRFAPIARSPAASVLPAAGPMTPPQHDRPAAARPHTGPTSPARASRPAPSPPPRPGCAPPLLRAWPGSPPTAPPPPRRHARGVPPRAPRRPSGGRRSSRTAAAFADGSQPSGHLARDHRDAVPVVRPDGACATRRPVPGSGKERVSPYPRLLPVVSRSLPGGRFRGRRGSGGRFPGDAGKRAPGPVFPGCSNKIVCQPRPDLREFGIDGRAAVWRPALASLRADTVS